MDHKIVCPELYTKALYEPWFKLDDGCGTAHIKVKSHILGPTTTISTKFVTYQYPDGPMLCC